MFNSDKPVSAKNLEEYFKEDFKKQSKEQGKNQSRTTNLKDGLTNNINKEEQTADLSAHQSLLDVNNLNFKIVWHGKIAQKFGLPEEVSRKHFKMICEGKHPLTGKELIKAVKPRAKKDHKGREYETLSRRAGLPQTVSAPKSVSLVVPHDPRVIGAHQKAVFKALDTVEEFTRVKMGNDKPPQQTGESIRALFLHIEARPDAETGFASLDLHTHCPPLNTGFDSKGKPRALEFREILRSQKLGTAVYRSELVKEMRDLGYEMRIDEKTGAPEVSGISREYIEASSSRHREIVERAKDLGIKSTKEIAVSYRQSKDFDREEMNRRRFALEEKFGFEAKSAAEKAIAKSNKAYCNQEQTFTNIHANEQKQNDHLKTDLQNQKVQRIKESVDLVIALNSEIKTKQPEKIWVSRQVLFTQAIEVGKLELTIDDIKPEFALREKNGELSLFELDERGQKTRNSQPKEQNLVSEKLNQLNENPKENYVESIEQRKYEFAINKPESNEYANEPINDASESALAGSGSVAFDDTRKFRIEADLTNVEPIDFESKLAETENESNDKSIDLRRKQCIGIAGVYRNGEPLSTNSNLEKRTSITEFGNSPIYRGTFSKTRETIAEVRENNGDGNEYAQRTDSRTRIDGVRKLKIDGGNSTISVKGFGSDAANTQSESTNNSERKRSNESVSTSSYETNSYSENPNLSGNENLVSNRTGSEKYDQLDKNSKITSVTETLNDDFTGNGNKTENLTGKSCKEGTRFSNPFFVQDNQSAVDKIGDQTIPTIEVSRRADDDSSKESNDHSFTKRSVSENDKNKLNLGGRKFSGELCERNDEQGKFENRGIKSENVLVSGREDSGGMDSENTGITANSSIVRNGRRETTRSLELENESGSGKIEQRSEFTETHSNSIGSNRNNLRNLGKSDDLLESEPEHSTNNLLSEHPNVAGRVSGSSNVYHEDSQNDLGIKNHPEAKASTSETKISQLDIPNYDVDLSSNTISFDNHERLVNEHDDLVEYTSDSVSDGNFDNQSVYNSSHGVEKLSDDDRARILDLFERQIQNYFAKINETEQPFDQNDIIDLKISSNGLYETDLNLYSNESFDQTNEGFSQQPSASDVYAQTQQLIDYNQKAAEQFNYDQAQLQQPEFSLDLQEEQDYQFDDVRRNFITYSSSSSLNEDDFWKRDRLQREAEIARERVQIKAQISENERLEYEAAETCENEDQAEISEEIILSL